MLGNNVIGDCTVAGADHIEMLWERQAGRSVTFTDQDATDDYSAFGYIPGRMDTDNGADMLTVAQYWQTTGMRDCTGQRHRIAAFASIVGSDSGSPDLGHVYQCAYLFGACGIGINLPDNAETQFENGEVWTVEPDAASDGYHFVPVIGRSPQGLLFVTWGKACWMTEDFFRVNCKEAVAYLPAVNAPNASLFMEAA